MEIFVVLLLALAALVWAAKSWSRIEQLEDKLRQSRQELARATERLGQLASGLKALKDTVARLEASPPTQPSPAATDKVPYVAPLPHSEEAPAELSIAT